MKFILPLPPSINRTYGVSRNGDHALYKRRPVKDWEYEAGQEINRQWKAPRTPFEGHVQVGITWYYRLDRDIDAGLKILLDLLERMGVVKNDRQIRRISNIDIAEDGQKPRVEIDIDPIE